MREGNPDAEHDVIKNELDVMIAALLAPQFHHEEVSSVGGSRFSDFALDRYGRVCQSVL
jgi:hypothetical protein